MYELQAMQKDDGSTLTPKLLREVFMKAKWGEPEVKTEIAAIRDQFSASMSVQDKACLEYLENNLGDLCLVEVDRI